MENRVLPGLMITLGEGFYMPGLFLVLCVCGNTFFKSHSNPIVLILSSVHVTYKNRAHSGHMTLVTQWE